MRDEDMDDVATRPRQEHVHDDRRGRLHREVRILLERRKDFLLGRLEDPSTSAAEIKQATRYLKAVKEDISSINFGGDMTLLGKLKRKWS